MSNYIWADTRPGSDLKRTGADPNKVSAEILQVDKIHGGKAPTGSYYDYVKDNPNAEGYKLFEHDDSKAAKKQRLNQEREIKRSLVIIKAEIDVNMLIIARFLNINSFLILVISVKQIALKKSDIGNIFIIFSNSTLPKKFEIEGADKKRMK